MNTEMETKPLSLYVSALVHWQSMVDRTVHLVQLAQGFKSCFANLCGIKLEKGRAEQSLSKACRAASLQLVRHTVVCELHWNPGRSFFLQRGAACRLLHVMSESRLSFLLLRFQATKLLEQKRDVLTRGSTASHADSSFWLGGPIEGIPATRKYAYYKYTGASSQSFESQPCIVEHRA
jgi:hypothetical protein